MWHMHWGGGRIALAGTALALLLVGASAAAPWLAPADPAAQDLGLGLSPPALAHPLGTDPLGRDLLSRVLWAGRVSLTATAIVLLTSLLLGSVVGVVAGYVGGRVDALCMRVVDGFLALPTIVLALALIGIAGPGFGNLVAALVVGWWPSYARLVRAKVLAVRHRDYVLAAEALGGTPAHIMGRHLLPAPLGALAVQLSLDVGHLVLAIAGLSFLGLGIQPPTPEWGTMLVDARPFMQLAPHLILAPGGAIAITVFGFNTLGEELERRLSPWR